ncbi:hypothetical protein FBU30_002601 [Linnemannia zychae]|nr:hypothetical protein FBU30_002601 [Linnemannia zychae]
MGYIGDAQGVTRYTLGILALLSVVCIWVSSSFLMNGHFTSTVDECIIQGHQEQMVDLSTGGDESTLEQGTSSTDNVKPLSYYEIAELSFAFCILWFAANWATNASLAYTTVASSTILASMSGFFTLAIGSILKTETFNYIKLGAVSASLLGVILVSEYDRGSSNMEPTAPKAPLFGDALALMSALFYGCYTVLLKLKIQNENRINMSLFFGFVGLFNLMLLWPLFGVLHWTGIEPFGLPHDTRETLSATAAFLASGIGLEQVLWSLDSLVSMERH